MQACGAEGQKDPERPQLRFGPGRQSLIPLITSESYYGD
jgi:hypothetical protein